MGGAIETLKEVKDVAIGDIKVNIAEYFGIPAESIFLCNKNGEILLEKNRVLEELFPMLSSKIVGYKPILNVCFKKKMSTLEYILGDQMIQEAKERQAKEKLEEERKIMEIKQQEENEKKVKKEKENLKEKIMKEKKNFKDGFGAVCTWLFMFFAFLHIVLSYG